MNNSDRSIQVTLLHIAKAIHSTPVPTVNKRTARVGMAAYHKKLRETIKTGVYISFPVPQIPDTKPTKKKGSKHRPYIHQLSELLVTSINIAAIEFQTEIKIVSGTPMIRMNRKVKPIFKKTYDEFLKTCLIGLTGDTEVLNDYRRVKSYILRNHNEDKNFNTKK